ncbi:hypothetical protein LLG39_01765 [bacterium]|nr:hypothetical protein [bacterium]
MLKAFSNTSIKWDHESNRLNIEHRGEIIFSGTVKWPGDAIESSVGWEEIARPAEAVYLGYPHGPERAGCVPDGLMARSIVVTISGAGASLTGTINTGSDAFTCIPEKGPEMVRGRFGTGDSSLDCGVFDRAGDWVLSVDEAAEMSINNTGEKFTLSAAGDEIKLVLYVDFYKIHRGYFFWNPEKTLWEKPISGWCSWAAYWNKITEDTIITAADLIDKELKDYGYNIILMDDGYQDFDCVNPKPLAPGQNVSDIWNKPLDKFPHGLGWLAEQISARGLMPGIWMSSAVPPGLPKKWYITDEQGKPFACETVKCSIDGMIDEAVEVAYKQTIRGLKEKGWRYFKVDSIRHVLYDSYRNAAHYWESRGENVDEAFRRIFSGIKDEIGQSIVMQSCWGTIPELAGVVDGCRIGEDVDANWDSIQAAAKYGCQFYYINNILWLNDPDYMCFRVPLEQCRAWATITALSGMQLMISDPVETYDEPRLDILRKVGPPLFVRPTTLRPLSPDCELWLLEVNKPDESWVVLGRIAWQPDGLSKRDITFAELGLAPDDRYLVFDFWNEELVGEFSGGFIAQALPEASCRVYGIRPSLDRPQVLSTNRHIGQGAHELEDVCWQNKTLSGKMILPPNRAFSLFVYVPDGYRLDESAPSDAQISVDGNVLKLTLTSTSGGSVNWSLRFAK